MVVDYLSSQPNRAGYQVSTKQGSGPARAIPWRRTPMAPQPTSPRMSLGPSRSCPQHPRCPRHQLRRRRRTCAIEPARSSSAVYRAPPMCANHTNLIYVRPGDFHPPAAPRRGTPYSPEGTPVLPYHDRRHRRGDCAGPVRLAVPIAGWPRQASANTCHRPWQGGGRGCQGR